MNPSRFLLVRLGALGDIVHAIPVAAALRRAFPSARIDWLVSAKFRDMLDLVPIIDRRITIGDGSIVATVAELRRGQYDVAIDLQGLVKSASLARSSGARRTIGFSRRYLREPLARLFYTEMYDPGGGGMYDLRERHVVVTNLGLLARLGLTGGVPEFPIERPVSEVARSLRARVGGRYAALNPGAAWPNKRWPAERFGETARSLDERHGLRSIVVWGPGEEALAREVVARAGGAAELAPPTTIGDLVAILDDAVVMVSGDTGPAHVATALGTPVVGIFGPTRPARNGPLSPADISVSRDGVCQCHHLRRCRLATMCLMDIRAGEVIAAIERRLSLKGAGA